MSLKNRVTLLAALLCVASTAAAQGLPATIGLATHNAILIAASPAEIWPHVVDPSAWKAGAKLIPLGDSAGRFKAVGPDDPDVALFYVDNVELVPERRRTIRLNAPDGALIGFASWELTQQDAATLVEYHVYSQQTLSPGQSRGAQREYQRSDFQRFQKELESLKRLVVGRGRR